MKKEASVLNKKLSSFLGVILLCLFISAIFIFFDSFLTRALFFLLFCCLVGIIKVFLGPRAGDRVIAITIIGMLIIGFCGILAISTGCSWYVDIAFVWALQSYIISLALAKFLAGRRFDE